MVRWGSNMDSKVMNFITKLWKKIPDAEKQFYTVDYLITTDPTKPDEMRYYHAYLFLIRYQATYDQKKKSKKKGR